jgi:4-hydroxy-2-oxoheptanedioate aldolase
MFRQLLFVYTIVRARFINYIGQNDIDYSDAALLLRSLPNVRVSRIRQKLAQNQPALVTTLHLTDPAVFELTSLMGFDGIWIDLEHHAHSVETVMNLMRAARVGTSDIVARPAKGEFMRMARLLEAGAQGIMYPRCDSAAEAAEVVKWAKFPPLGKRGLDGGNPDMPYCSMSVPQYVKEANEQTFIIIQIEEDHAIDAAEEIAAVEGVDVLMLGPADYSSLSGFAGDFSHPRIAQAEARIADATRKQGKHWGRPALSLADAEALVAKGAHFIPYGSDLSMLKRNLEQMQRDFTSLGFTFTNQLSPTTKHKEPLQNGAPHIRLVTPQVVTT